MTEILKGKIPENEGLREVLEIVNASKDVNIGILFVSGDDASGRIGIAWGRYITGAMLDSGETGRKSLRTLLSVRSGTFRFVDTHGEPDMQLRQSLGVDLNVLMQYGPSDFRHDVTPFLFDTDEMVSQQSMQTGATGVSNAAGVDKPQESRSTMADLASAITDITEDNTQLLNSVDLYTGLTLGDELRTAYEKAINQDPSGLQQMPLPTPPESNSPIQPSIDISRPAQGNHVVEKATDVVQRIGSELGNNATIGIAKPPLESLEPTIEIVKPARFDPPSGRSSSDDDTQSLSKDAIESGLQEVRQSMASGSARDAVAEVAPQIPAETKPETVSQPVSESAPVVPEPTGPAPMSSLKKPFTRLIGAARNRSIAAAEARQAAQAKQVEEAAAAAEPQPVIPPPVHEVGRVEPASPVEPAPPIEPALPPEPDLPVPEILVATESKADILRQARKEAANYLAQETHAATHLRLKPISKVNRDPDVSPATSFHTSFELSPTLEADVGPIKPQPYKVQLPPPPVPSWSGGGETKGNAEPEPAPVPQSFQERLELDTIETVKAIEILQDTTFESSLNVSPVLEEQTKDDEPPPPPPAAAAPPQTVPPAQSMMVPPAPTQFTVSGAVAEAMLSFKDPDVEPLSPWQPAANVSPELTSSSPHIEWNPPVIQEDIKPRKQAPDEIWPSQALTSREPHINMADLRGKRPVPPLPGHPFLDTLHDESDSGSNAGAQAGKSVPAPPALSPRFELPELIPVPGGNDMEPPGTIPLASEVMDRAQQLSDADFVGTRETSPLRTIMFCLVLFVLSCLATVLFAPKLLHFVTSSFMHH